MIAWVDSLLIRWGAFAMRADAGGLGYSDTAPGFAQHQSSGVYESHEPFGVCGQDYDDVARCIMALPFVLRAVVETHYKHSRCYRDTASKCGIHHKSVKQYLGQAHGLIAQRLDEMRLGA